MCKSNQDRAEAAVQTSDSQPVIAVDLPLKGDEFVFCTVRVKASSEKSKVCAAWQLLAAVKQFQGVAEIIGVPVVTFDQRDAAASTWDIKLEALKDFVRLTVIGDDAIPVDWCCLLSFDENY